REMRVWSRLSHANLVPLLGYVNGVHGPGFVSPWYSERDAISFLKNHPSANRSMIVRCAEVASGLEYLHSQLPPIVHGDIKGAIIQQNILIASDGRACICDFGLSRILDNNPTGFTFTTVGMSLRFSAPELLDREDKTMEADIYAYGCTCIEILLDKRPYETIRSDKALLAAIVSGTPPIAPEQLEGCKSLLPLHILKQCWNVEPLDRPQAKQLTEVFRGAIVSHAD
ncbi:kinase-like domain-containing protein, partial [Cantharellus anzutake]|uniref:kinase-like domain-containing protein n=1 Tax=Cantharellus anzutake TaxID=1750568 RepID=UPI001904A32A